MQQQMLTINLDSDVHQLLKLDATRNCTSMTSIVRRLINEYLGVEVEDGDTD